MVIDQNHLKDRYRMLPDLKVVAYFELQIPGDGNTFKQHEINSVEKRWPTRKDMESSNVQIRESKMFFHIWKEKTTIADLKEGDQIELGTDLWIVNVATLELQDTRWRLGCTKGIFKDPSERTITT
jgi:hypothetical protein